MLIEMLTAGERLVCDPNAVVHHSHRATLAELEQQLRGYGTGCIAMLGTDALHDESHALGVAAMVPAWLRSLHDPSSARNAHRTQDYPAALARADLAGKLSGPFVYALTPSSAAMEAMRPQLHESMTAAVRAAVLKDRASPERSVCWRAPWRLR